MSETVPSAARCSHREHNKWHHLHYPNYPGRRLGLISSSGRKNMYVLIVDYYSRYIEITRLSGESAIEVISKTKSIFARHGIRETVMSA